MSEQVFDDQSQRAIRYVSFIVAFIITVVGVLNSMPTYGIIPPFGPFPAVVLRPLFLGAAVFLVLANSSFTSTFAQRWPDFKSLGRIVDVVLLLVAWWVLWEYYDRQISEETGGFEDIGLYDFAVSLIAGCIFSSLV